MRKLLLIALLSLWQFSNAAENDLPAQDTDGEVSPESVIEDQDEGSDLIAAEIVETNEDEESSARFIPTEEISQDLGVSFPVDI